MRAGHGQSAGIQLVTPVVREAMEPRSGRARCLQGACRRRRRPRCSDSLPSGRERWAAAERRRPTDDSRPERSASAVVVPGEEGTHHPGRFQSSEGCESVIETLYGFRWESRREERGRRHRRLSPARPHTHTSAAAAETTFVVVARSSKNAWSARPASHSVPRLGLERSARKGEVSSVAR